jgi:hypothetical protein
MVTPLTWTSYLDAIARLAVVDVADENFVALAPQMVNYAELRMCRDLDFLSTVGTVSSLSLVANQRMLTFPMDMFVTLQDVNIITPVGAANPDAGKRNPLVWTSKEYLLYVYGSVEAAALPRYVAMLTQNAVLFGPWPDAAYKTELVGTVRPPSLSATNPTTFIATYLPDIFIMASMIWISGYQRNFGRQSDDPQMAVSYESQYMTLLKGGMVEEARKKMESAAWTSMSPAVVASPSRQAAG